MNKKAQGISINVIIIAAIALIVLVVLVAVFTGRFGMFAGGVSKTGDPNKACNAQDGITAQPKDSCGPGERIIAAKTDPGKLCCAT